MSSALATVLLLTCVVNRAHGFWGSSAHLRCQDSRHALGVACRASVELLEDEKDPVRAVAAPLARVSPVMSPNQYPVSHGHDRLSRRTAPCC